MKKLIIFLLLVGAPVAIYTTGQPAVAKEYMDIAWAKISPHVEKLTGKAKATITNYVEDSEERLNSEKEEGGGIAGNIVNGIMEKGQDSEGRGKPLDAVETFGVGEEHTGNLKGIEGGFNKKQGDLDMINSLTQ